MASSPSSPGRRLTPWIVVGVFAVQIVTLSLLWLLDAVFGTP